MMISIILKSKDNYSKDSCSKDSYSKDSYSKDGKDTVRMVRMQ